MYKCSNECIQLYLAKTIRLSFLLKSWGILTTKFTKPKFKCCNLFPFSEEFFHSKSYVIHVNYFDLLLFLDDDDDEEYDEPNGGNSLLGFMFGNVDNSGDLDADYLDKV